MLDLTIPCQFSVNQQLKLFSSEKHVAVMVFAISVLLSSSNMHRPFKIEKSDVDNCQEFQSLKSNSKNVLCRNDFSYHCFKRFANFAVDSYLKII